MSKYHALFYDLVEGILEKRTPYREEHLALAKAMHEKGILLQAGAFTPPKQSMFIFKTDDVNLIEDFAQKDPYVIHGLVSNYTILPYNVAVGG